jgi:hypothetical protein
MNEERENGAQVEHEESSAEQGPLELEHEESSAEQGPLELEHEESSAEQGPEELPDPDREGPTPDSENEEAEEGSEGG